MERRDTMDCSKFGDLILSLRKEKNMTQKEIANRMHISDKTISKWERGLGYPDVALLSNLSDILGVNIEKILNGNLEEKDMDGGNMKHVKFYVCEYCSNIITATSQAEPSCCGRKLYPLVVKSEDEAHMINLTDNGNEYYITIDHPMLKTHYISFVAFVGFDTFMITKLYPEQNADLYIPKIQHGKLYVYCIKHGLCSKKI